MEHLTEALAGIAAAVRATGTDQSEVVAVWQPWRGEFRVTVSLAERDREGLYRGSRRFDGYGAALEAAYVHAWRGDLGVWRFTDPDAWEAAVYPAGRRPAGNPGPLAGQRMGRSDG
jgi:hypothetical protein